MKKLYLVCVSILGSPFCIFSIMSERKCTERKDECAVVTIVFEKKISFFLIYIILSSSRFRTVEFVSFLILARGRFYRNWFLRQSVVSG